MTAPPQISTPTPVNGSRRWLRPLLFLLLPVALVLGGYEYVVGGQVMSTENAYVRADIVAISTDVSGMVKAIDVRDNQTVKAGDVLFRLLQGFFGASLVPLAQSILLDIHTPEERGGAMALFGVSVMVGPVLGPVIGGWLTDNISWRWVFYINLPLGLLAFAGVSAFVTETRIDRGRALDWLGFGALSVSIAALQLCLDRGEQLDWFGSGEVLIEAIVAASAFYVFLVHTFTAQNPFVNPSLFRDRNFATGMLFIFVVGITYLASLALMTPYLQTLMGYPVVTAGIVMGPRGMGTMLCMFIAGKLIGRVDIRLLLAVGLGLTAWAMYDMTGWTPDVSQWTIVSTGFIQGAGLGFLFVPLTTVTFSTLPAAKRGDGTGLYNLSCNIGSAVGISAVSALLTEHTQANHAEIGSYITPYNRLLQAAPHILDPLTLAGRSALDDMVTLQATVIGYIDDFKLMMLLCLGALPLLLLFRRAAQPAEVDHTIAME